MLNCFVQSFGAAGDGVTLDTRAVQAAIDACSAHGGGRVTLSEGRFLCGRIDLKDGVELHIERDAVLLGSPNPLDYPEIETDFWWMEYAPRFNRRCLFTPKAAGTSPSPAAAPSTARAKRLSKECRRTRTAGASGLISAGA